MKGTWAAGAAIVMCLVMGGLPVAGQSPAGSSIPSATGPEFLRLQYDADSQQILLAWTLEPRAAPRPAVLAFHGGGMVEGSPYDFVVEDGGGSLLASMGYVTFAVGYRLFDAATGANMWPVQLDDAQRAVRWVRAHAAEYNVDPDRICALGHSAGGQLAELLGTMDTRDDSDPDLAAYSSRVDCVVGLAGAADLTLPYNRYAVVDIPSDMAISAGLLGGTLAENPELWQAASPVFHVDARTVPMLIIHGSADEYVPVEQARHMVDVMHDAGAEVVYAEFPRQTHMGILGLEQSAALLEAFLGYELHPER